MESAILHVTVKQGWPGVYLNVIFFQPACNLFPGQKYKSKSYTRRCIYFLLCCMLRISLALWWYNRNDKYLADPILKKEEEGEEEGDEEEEVSLLF